MFAICAHNWPGKSDVNKAYTQIDSQGDSTNSVWPHITFVCTLFASTVPWQMGVFVTAMSNKCGWSLMYVFCSAVINFLHHHSHQLQVLYLDGEELTDNSIDAVSSCPVLRCLRVSFSGLLTDRCLSSLKVFWMWFYIYVIFPDIVKMPKDEWPTGTEIWMQKRKGPDKVKNKFEKIP